MIPHGFFGLSWAEIVAVLTIIGIVYAAGCDIKAYLDLGTITQEQFDEITGAEVTA